MFIDAGAPSCSARAALASSYIVAAIFALYGGYVYLADVYNSLYFARAAAAWRLCQQLLASCAAPGDDDTCGYSVATAAAAGTHYSKTTRRDYM